MPSENAIVYVTDKCGLNTRAEHPRGCFFRAPENVRVPSEIKITNVKGEDHWQHAEVTHVSSVAYL